MHVAVVTRNMQAGGAERVISQLLNGWLADGHTCSLILLDRTEIFYRVSDKVHLYEIGKIANKHYLDKLKRYKAVRRILQEIKPDVVLSMPEEIGIYVIGAMLGTGIPVVVSERNDPWTMPYVKATRILRKILYPFAAGYIFQTKRAASFFSKRIQKKGTVLPNPLDLSRIPEPFCGERDKTVVGAGRFEAQKNFPMLIDAFAEFYKSHSDYKLIIYGDGRLRGQMLAYAAERLPIYAFDFPGRISDLPERTCRGGMFVLSSDFEGMPNVLIEAMSMGVPCVSTDCPSGGPAEFITDGKNGYLVPVGDSAAMAEKMCLIADGRAVFDNLNENAERIKARLNASAVCKDWLTYLMQHSRKKG